MEGDGCWDGMEGEGLLTMQPCPLMIRLTFEGKGVLFLTGVEGSGKGIGGGGGGGGDGDCGEIIAGDSSSSELKVSCGDGAKRTEEVTEDCRLL